MTTALLNTITPETQAAIMRVGLPKAGGALVKHAKSNGYPVLLSSNALARRKDGQFIGWRRSFKDLEGVNAALDSAGFVAWARYGGFEWGVENYLDLVAARPWAWWAQMDACVEAEIATSRELVRLRQAETIRLLRECQIGARRRGLPAPVKVLQGATPADYVWHAEQVIDGDEELVGVGSMCRRQLHGPEGLLAVVAALDEVLPAGVKLHLFGIKSQGMRALALHPRVASADSMAWDFRARKLAHEGDFSNTIAHRCAIMDAWVDAQELAVELAAPSTLEPQAHEDRDGFERLTEEWAELVECGEVDLQSALMHMAREQAEEGNPEPLEDLDAAGAHLEVREGAARNAAELNQNQNNDKNSLRAPGAEDTLTTSPGTNLDSTTTGAKGAPQPQARETDMQNLNAIETARQNIESAEATLQTLYGKRLPKQLEALMRLAARALEIDATAPAGEQMGAAQIRIDLGALKLNIRKPEALEAAEALRCAADALVGELLKAAAPAPAEVDLDKLLVFPVDPSSEPALIGEGRERFFSFSSTFVELADAVEDVTAKIGDDTGDEVPGALLALALERTREMARVKVVLDPEECEDGEGIDLLCERLNELNDLMGALGGLAEHVPGVEAPRADEFIDFTSLPVWGEMDNCPEGVFSYDVREDGTGRVMVQGGEAWEVWEVEGVEDEGDDDAAEGELNEIAAEVEGAAADLREAAREAKASIHLEFFGDDLGRNRYGFHVDALRREGDLPLRILTAFVGRDGDVVAYSEHEIEGVVDVVTGVPCTDNRDALDLALDLLARLEAEEARRLERRRLIEEKRAGRLAMIQALRADSDEREIPKPSEGVSFSRIAADLSLIGEAKGSRGLKGGYEVRAASGLIDYAMISEHCERSAAGDLSTVDFKGRVGLVTCRFEVRQGFGVEAQALEAEGALGAAQAWVRSVLGNPEALRAAFGIGRVSHFSEAVGHARLTRGWKAHTENGHKLGGVMLEARRELEGKAGAAPRITAVRAYVGPVSKTFEVKDWVIQPAFERARAWADAVQMTRSDLLDAEGVAEKAKAHARAIERAEHTWRLIYGD